MSFIGIGNTLLNANRPGAFYGTRGQGPVQFLGAAPTITDDYIESNAINLPNNNEYSGIYLFKRTPGVVTGIRGNIGNSVQVAIFGNDKIAFALDGYDGAASVSLHDVANWTSSTLLTVAGAWYCLAWTIDVIGEKFRSYIFSLDQSGLENGVYWTTEAPRSWVSADPLYMNRTTRYGNSYGGTSPLGDCLGVVWESSKWIDWNDQANRNKIWSATTGMKDPGSDGTFGGAFNQPEIFINDFQTDTPVNKGSGVGALTKSGHPWSAC